MMIYDTIMPVTRLTQSTMIMLMQSQYSNSQFVIRTDANRTDRVVIDRSEASQRNPAALWGEPHLLRRTIVESDQISQPIISSTRLAQSQSVKLKVNETGRTKPRYALCSTKTHFAGAPSMCDRVRAYTHIHQRGKSSEIRYDASVRARLRLTSWAHSHGSALHTYVLRATCKMHTRLTSAHMIYWCGVSTVLCAAHGLPCGSYLAAAVTGKYLLYLR